MVVKIYLQKPNDGNFFVFPPESATSSSLVSEDWDLNMEICDIINSSEEGCVVSYPNRCFPEI